MQTIRAGSSIWLMILLKSNVLTLACTQCRSLSFCCVFCCFVVFVVEWVSDTLMRFNEIFTFEEEALFYTASPVRWMCRVWFTWCFCCCCCCCKSTWYRNDKLCPRNEIVQLTRQSRTVFFISQFGSFFMQPPGYRMPNAKSPLRPISRDSIIVRKIDAANRLSVWYVFRHRSPCNENLISHPFRWLSTDHIMVYFVFVCIESWVASIITLINKSLPLKEKNR